MDKAEAEALVRRFVALPRDRRRTFWAALRQNEVDLTLLPIPGGIAQGERREPSHAQRRMWLLWQLDREAAAYNIATAQRLTGPLDMGVLEAALQDLCRRQETLRTTFDDAAGQLAQHVWPEAALTLARIDLRDRAGDELAPHLRAGAQAPFDLERGPLLRASLFRLGDREHVLQLVMHHIVTDAWSLRVMVEELSALYAARRFGAPAGLPALDVQYSDYALWQRSWLEAGEGERQLAYWTGHLGGGEQVLELPTDRPRPAVWSYRGAVARLAVPKATVDGLKALAQRGRTTPFVVLLAAFAVLLRRWSGQVDLRIGVPVANRARAETEGLIGLFVNTQLFRVEVDDGASFAALLERVREAALGAQAHQDLPFEQLVDALRPERSLGRNPLFQVMFGHERIETGDARLGEVRVEEVPFDAPVAQFDLSLATQEHGDGGIVCAFTYATDLFDAGTIERLGGWFLNLLEGIAARPEQAVGDLPLLTAGERRWLVAGCNDTAAAYDTAIGLLARLRRQAEATPDAPALVAGAERLDYRELHARADRLATGLRAEGIGPEALVGLLAERSAAMVVGILGILKAGAAWVPLDPELPSDRLAYMVAQSGMKLVLAQQHLPPPAGDVPVRFLEEDSGEAGAPAPEPRPGQLAYCIYTSGTTGRPKGVGNSHAGLLNRLLWMQEQYRLGPADRVLQKTPFGFDVSVWELLWPLMTGATLVMAPPGAHRDPAVLRGLIQSEGITVLHFVPSMLQAFMAVEDIGACTSLRAVICSGEALPVDLRRQFLAASKAGLHNLYGPTEAAIDVTSWVCRDEPGRSSVPIGSPIANTQIHLLDERVAPVPVGVLGELCIGGVQLARGYVGRRGLTAERFVPDPFAGDGSRLYRTGDLARRRADGVIDYAGRTDHQVKIRGFRIEPGEIEARLVEHPEVAEALVIARETPSGRQLVAYLLGSAPAEALKEHLRQTLPDYMVPARFVTLDRLPLSANGKLDRKALPEPDWPEAGATEPTTPAERLLCQAWQDLLGLPKVGTGDNFFDLGGDSILAIQLVGRARALGLQLSPRDVFRHQTVRDLAAVARLDTVPAARRPEATGESALLPIQRWFFEQPMPERSHWNQAVLLRPRESVDRVALEHALCALIVHHEALRLRFKRDAQGEWRQLFVPTGDLAGPHLAVSSAGFDELEAVVAAAHAALDIESGRVMRAELIGLPDGSARLLLVIHHLVVDGVSWRILLEDLAAAYGQAKQGQAASLPDRTSSVQQWAAALAGRAWGGGIDSWEAQLSGPVAALPGEWIAERSLNRHAAQLTSSLDRSRTAGLLTAPHAYRMRVDELLLAALARSLCRWSGGEAVLVQLEGHGREEELTPGIDLSRTVGWLTSLYPVRLAAPLDLGPDALLKSVKEQLRAVPDRGLAFGLLRYLASPEVRERTRALPAPEVTFNYLGRFDSSFGDDAPFLAAAESSGEGLAPDSPMISPLTLEAQIHDGVLTLDWRYSRTRFDEAGMRRLAANFEGALLDLIEHCAAGGGVTPSDFPLAELTQAQLDGLPLPPDRIEDVLPLAPMQEGLLMHTLLEPTSGIYLMQEHYFVDSALEPETFFRAWRLVLQRNAAMRATFHWNTGGQVVQAIVREPDVAMDLLDWSGEEPETWRPRLEAILATELGEGLELRRSPPFRLRLLRLAGDRFCFVLSYHHILMDAWSRSHLLDDLLVVYRALLEGTSPPPRDAAPFGSFIAWLRGQDVAATHAFWGRVLEGFTELTPLPTIRPAPRPVDDSVIGDVMTFLGEDETAALRELAHERQLTVNSFVQAAWALMLYFHSGRDDVLFGVTVAGRPADRPELEKTVGLFISSIPLRVRLPHPASGRTVAEWLAELQAQNLAMREHEHLPLVAIAECSELPRGTPLFDSLFVFESEPLNFSLDAGAAGLSARAGDMRTHTNYPLTVVVYPGDRLGLHYSYDRRFLDDAAMPELLERFKRVLLRIVEGIDEPVRDLRLLDADERAALLAAGNATERQFPLDRGYAALFAASVVRHGGRVAASCAGEQLTYAALDRQANRIAHALLAEGVRPDEVVAVLDERGLDLLAMILGVLKAGAAFLALDPALPPQRLAENVRSANARIVLCGDTFAPLLADDDQGRPELRMGELAERELPAHDPGIEVGPRHLAYLIHTSGSTGRPKGVMVEQAGMLNNQLSKLPRFGLAPDDVIAQTASQAFDISVWQFLAALLCGARVEIVPDAVAHDPLLLLGHVARSGVTVLECVPSLIQAMLLEGRQSLGRLRWLLPTGEALPPGVARDWSRRYPEVPLVNAYGPAECSDDVALHQVAADEDATGYVPIGSATDNNRLYVLDAALEPSPAGAVGELYVAGTGVGRGYVEAPAQTAAAFLPDPFAAEPGGRLYRTGDLARRRADGLIEYVGRADQQVKIRGFRIELGEIEARLRGHPAVREACAVVVGTPAGDQLVGYAAGTVEPEALRLHLKSCLPDYMVPARIVLLERLPRLPSGKLDRRGLPMPEWQEAQLVAPRTPVEADLAAIWAELLGVERVGVTDDFYQAGGHSLLLTRLLSRVRAGFAVEVPLAELFGDMTVEGMARRIEARRGPASDTELDAMADILAELEQVP